MLIRASASLAAAFAASERGSFRQGRIFLPVNREIRDPAELCSCSVTGRTPSPVEQEPRSGLFTFSRHALQVNSVAAGEVAWPISRGSRLHVEQGIDGRRSRRRPWQMSQQPRRHRHVGAPPSQATEQGRALDAPSSARASAWRNGARARAARRQRSRPSSGSRRHMGCSSCRGSPALEHERGSSARSPPFWSPLRPCARPGRSVRGSPDPLRVERHAEAMRSSEGASLLGRGLLYRWLSSMPARGESVVVQARGCSVMSAARITARARARPLKPEVGLRSRRRRMVPHT